MSNFDFTHLSIHASYRKKSPGQLPSAGNCFLITLLLELHVSGSWTGNDEDHEGGVNDDDGDNEGGGNDDDEDEHIQQAFYSSAGYCFLITLLLALHVSGSTS